MAHDPAEARPNGGEGIPSLQLSYKQTPEPLDLGEREQSPGDLDLQLTEEERREESDAGSRRPVFADPLCIPLLHQLIRAADGECTACVDKTTHMAISAGCETHGSQIPELFSCIISDKTWLARMLQTGHRLVLLGPSAGILEISDLATIWQEMSTESFLGLMLSETRLTLLCVDGKGRCVPLDKPTLDANNIMGISGCSHPYGVSTRSIKTVRKTMLEKAGDNVKPILRRLGVKLDFATFEQDLRFPVAGSASKGKRRLYEIDPWQLALSLPLSFEDVREPLWMEAVNFFPWLKWESICGKKLVGERRRRLRDLDNWDKLGDRQLETAYLMLEQSGSSVGTAAAQSQWDWGGTEGDCMVVSTTVTKQRSNLGDFDEPSRYHANGKARSLKTPCRREPKEVSTRNLFFHLQGIPIT